MSDSDRSEDIRPKWVIPALAIAVAVLVIALGYVTWTTSNNWNVSQQNAREIQSYAKRYERERCSGLDVAEGIKCIADARKTANDQERDEADLYAQRQMAVWAFLVAVTAFVSVPMSLTGILLVWKTLTLNRDAVNAAIAGNRIAEIERDPLIAIDSVEVISASVQRPGTHLTIHVKMRNAGGSAARGFIAKVKFNLAQPDGFDAFVAECRAANRDKKYVLLKDQPHDETTSLYIARKTYDDWLESFVKPLREAVQEVYRVDEVMRVKAQAEGSYYGTMRHEPQAERELRIVEQNCRYSGMPLHVYVVATWIGIEPSKVGFAAREYRAAVLGNDGNEDGRKVPMDDNIGPLALSLIPVGSQVLGPLPDER